MFQQGATIPVFADPDASKLQIDFGEIRNPAGGGDEISEAGAPGTGAYPHAQFPDAPRQQMVDGWVAAAKAGKMSPKTSRTRSGARSAADC